MQLPHNPSPYAAGISPAEQLRQARESRVVATDSRRPVEAVRRIDAFPRQGEELRRGQFFDFWA